MSRNRTTLLVLLCWIALGSIDAAAQTDRLPDNPIVSISASSDKVRFLIGEIAQLTIQGVFTDGTQKDLTTAPGITYTPSVDGIVVVDSGGLVHGVARGSVALHVNYTQTGEVFAETSIDLEVQMPARDRPQ